jgi:hypothetical protein
MKPTIGPIHSRGVLKNDKPHPPTFAVHQGYGTFKTGDPVRFPLNVARTGIDRVLRPPQSHLY